LIVVFGGNGQLGRELERASDRAQLTALARKDADITDEFAVSEAIRRYRPALVVNAAAYTKVDLAESEPREAQEVNGRAPGLIGHACAQAGVPLVHVSTDYVFDGSKAGPYTEDDPIAPLSAYGRSKAAGEAAVRAACARHVILRTAWLYGAFGNNFLKTMLRLAATRDELSVVADQHGSPTSTRDLAGAILRIAPRLIAGENLWGIYHFTGTGVTTWHGFATQIVTAQASLTGRHPKVIAITTADYPTAARRPANSELDNSRFAHTFGFRSHAWQDETEVAVRAVLAVEARNASHVA
jgi:dTDP-4-dehydrorhamnose reductase